MSNDGFFLNRFNVDKVKKLFSELYGKDDNVINNQISRYNQLINDFLNKFSGDTDDIHLFSTPGRTEIGGNHTDHNKGKVLAAAVNLDSIAAVRKNDNGTVTVYSKGFDEPFVVRLDNLDPYKEEEGTTRGLIRGIASCFVKMGYSIGGFDAYISSNVLQGSGLSSSASIEVLIGNVFNSLYNGDKLYPSQLASIGQYAENVFFNKPCGLMDQMACAIGGFVAIDFKNEDDPLVKKVDFDFSTSGYSLLIINTGGNHADLTDDYASIPAEMKSVAAALGKEVLRDLKLEDVISNINMLRSKTGDRALLRAIHYFGDNDRVVKQVDALDKGRFDDFLNLVNESGSSSWRLLQNCYTNQNPTEQGITLALALTESFMENQDVKGAYRVHGGGFAGTIQVFLPNDMLEKFIDHIESAFGKGAVEVLSIRPYGTLYLNGILTR